jgi:hypothetical protein
MAVSLSFATVGEKITAALYNAVVNVVNVSTSGLIIPTVSGTGTSITADATGLVTFTAATVVTCDAAFPSAYRKHKISIQTLNNAGTATFIFRTSAPADDTSARYDYSQDLARNAAVTAATTPSTAFWGIVSLPSALVECELEFVGVPLAQPTTGFMRTGHHSNPAVQNTSNGIDQRYLTQQESAAFAGFKITFSAACSGTIRITGEY